MSWIDGPTATVIASITAAGVAIWFGRAQASTARSQAATAAAQKEIAFDKLKLDTFDKRYEIYRAAKALIEAILSTPAPARYITAARDAAVLRVIKLAGGAWLTIVDLLAALRDDPSLVRRRHPASLLMALRSSVLALNAEGLIDLRRSRSRAWRFRRRQKPALSASAAQPSVPSQQEHTI